MASTNAYVALPSTFHGRTAKTKQTNLAGIRSNRETVKCAINKNQDSIRRRRPTRKASAFENTIEDLTMKRMGRGTIYYGERVSGKENEQVSDEDEEQYLLKPDPVLVTGATGRTGQWIALGLMNQGFNVRGFSRSFDKVEKLFGPSGSNLDVFEGNLTKYNEVLEAVDGATGVVCASGSPWWIPGGLDAVDVVGVENLVKASLQSTTVKRFILISSADANSARGKAKRRAEKLVQESGLPYTILRTGQLLDIPGGEKDIQLELSSNEQSKTLSTSRIDLAQGVCQTLVYSRAIETLKEQDPEGDFNFPNCTITVSNGNDGYIPDKRFWKRQFSRISDECSDKDGLTSKQ